jgi:uridine kinase
MIMAGRDNSVVDVSGVIAAIEAARSATLSGRLVVGISGFGGSGKSTLTRELVSAIPRAARIRGDDFLDPVRSHRRSPDWDGMERGRLRREVLDPFHRGEPSEFRRFDWGTGALGDLEAVPAANILIVDAVGLFHPELDEPAAIDLRIWVDVDLETATARGKARDREARSDHTALWDNVWVPNERDFAERFSPRKNADLVYRPGATQPVGRPA